MYRTRRVDGAFARLWAEAIDLGAQRLEEEGFATRAQRLQATVARDAAERVTFATWAIVTGKSPGGIFNKLPVLSEDVAQQLTDRLNERTGGDLDVEVAVEGDRLVVLRGLEVLRHVRVEVVLPGEAAGLRDRAAEREAEAVEAGAQVRTRRRNTRRHGESDRKRLRHQGLTRVHYASSIAVTTESWRSGSPAR